MTFRSETNPSEYVEIVSIQHDGIKSMTPITQIQKERLTDGQWHFVVVTWDNAQGNMKFYLDQVEYQNENGLNTGQQINKL